jgi:Family of unknown function (DUF6082)
MSDETIAVVSTLISSVALIGVVISLLLQARQLRISQLQASRTAQAELLKVAIEEPEMASVVLGWPSVEQFSKSMFINLQVKALELSYIIKTSTTISVRLQASLIFRSEFVCEWWRRNRYIYQEEASTRREREFYSIMDDQFSKASEPPGVTDDANQPPTSGSVTSSPPSS